MREKFNYNKLREVFVSRQIQFLLGFGGLIILLLFALPKAERTVVYPSVATNAENSKGGIDALRDNLEKLKKEAGLNDFGYESKYEQMQEAKETFTKTTEEIRQDLLSNVKPQDQLDFESELETVFKLGEHKAFFIRQIENCQIKMDLAVVGIGIIRVHEVLRGENLSVQEKDQEAFIRYIKEQIQYALSAEDSNYKAIVFKGLESSAG